jgi:hypothetical protein
MLLKAIVIAAAVVAAATLQALAGDSSRLLETSEEARQRRGADAWQRYEQRRYVPPLGGYRERLGDPWQPSAERPGYLPDRSDGADGTGRGWPPARGEPQ